MSAFLAWLRDFFPDLIAYAVRFVFEASQVTFVGEWFINRLPTDFALAMSTGDVFYFLEDIPLIGYGLAVGNWLIPYAPLVAIWATAFSVAGSIRLIRHALGALPLNLG
jgi:hypothetical protein